MLIDVYVNVNSRRRGALSMSLPGPSGSPFSTRWFTTKGSRAALNWRVLAPIVPRDRPVMFLCEGTWMRSFLLAWLALSALCLGVANGVAAAVDDEDGPLNAGEAEFDEVEAAKKAREAAKGSWDQGKDEQIAVQQRVLTKKWNKVPFEQRPFHYTPERIKAEWATLLSGLNVPYPSAAFMRTYHERFPELVSLYPQFDGDFDKLERDLLRLWQLFLRGDFQEAMQYGDTLGPVGRLAGKVSQVFYAIYLEPSLADKHMLLQDSANVIRDFGESFEKMKKMPEPMFRDQYVTGRLAYTYAIGRIAEDVPIPVAIGRNYVFKVLGAIDDVQTLAPDNPLGAAARAAADANVVRKVGKATGRVTFGARQASIRSAFEGALAVTDRAVLRYEYANAILYMNKKRDIDETMTQLKRAQAIKPRFAMEALDAMYAAKRYREVEALAKSQASFRSFERKRLKYQKDRGENLYCVLPDVCKPYLIN